MKASEKDKVLVIYTSHRLDSFILMFKCLRAFTDLKAFKDIYVIANEVHRVHLRYLNDLASVIPHLHIVPASPRGLVPAVMRAMNGILDQHRDDIVVKMDEDLFVTPGWLQKMEAAYDDHADDPEKLVITALPFISHTPGRRLMADWLESEYPEEWARIHRFRGHFGQNKYYHRFIWEKVVDDNLTERFRASLTEPYAYVDYVVINCIMFDNRLMERVHPFPEHKIDNGGTLVGMVDELTISRNVRAVGQGAAVATDCIVHHYSHWPSEEFLRRHVPLSRVEDFFNAEYGLKEKLVPLV